MISDSGLMLNAAGGGFSVYTDSRCAVSYLIARFTLRLIALFGRSGSRSPLR